MQSRCVSTISWDRFYLLILYLRNQRGSTVCLCPPPPHPHLIFRPSWGLEGPNKFFSELTLISRPGSGTEHDSASIWENLKTDLRSQIIWILHYQKNGRSEKDHLPRQRQVLVLLVLRKIKEKDNKLIPRGEDKREKQHKLRMNIRNVYISVRNTYVSRIEYILR